MDHLWKLMVRAFASGVGRKLAYVLVGALVAFIASQAHAMGSVGAPTNQTINGYRCPSTEANTFATTALAACQLKASNSSGTFDQFCSSAGAVRTTTRTYTITTLDAPNAKYTYNITFTTPNCTLTTGYNSTSTGAGQFTYAASTTSEVQCPSNSNLSAGVCVCSAGFKPNSGATACEPQGACQNVADSLNAQSSVLYAQGAGLGLTACFSGCVMSGGIAGADSSGRYVAGPFSASGAVCNGSSPLNGNDGGAPPTPPKPGNCPGTVNGVSVPGGVPCSGGQQGAGPTDTKGPDSTASSPAGTTPGTSSSTGGTTCLAGNCTTTTTTTTNNANGTTTTGTGTKTEGKDDFCAKNPGNPMCKDENEGAFGGTCGAGFTCDGKDAVQCAMAKEQFIRNCQLIETPTAMSAIGDSGVGNAANSRGNASDHPINSAQAVAISLATQLSTVPLFGAAGQCPQDVSFSHAGYSFALPFSMLCPYLQLLGAAFMAACFMAAGYIVFIRS